MLPREESDVQTKRQERLGEESDVQTKRQERLGEGSDVEIKREKRLDEGSDVDIKCQKKLVTTSSTLRVYALRRIRAISCTLRRP